MIISRMGTPISKALTSKRRVRDFTHLFHLKLRDLQSQFPLYHPYTPNLRAR
jgi:hypothetical protein